MGFTISEAGVLLAYEVVRVLQGAANLLLDPSKISLAGFPRAIARDSSCSARCVKIAASIGGISYGSMEHRGGRHGNEIMCCRVFG